MLERENLCHELLNDGYTGIGASGKGQIENARQETTGMHLFIRAILEVEGARGYDITAVGLPKQCVRR